MKHLLIKYTRKSGSDEDWGREVGRFIKALDTDPALSGKIAYRCLKHKEGDDYYHVVAVADEDTTRTLNERDFFSAYTKRVGTVSGGTVEVLPLELIAETAFRA